MADQDCSTLGVPAGTADAAQTLEFATDPGALPIAVFLVGFFAATIERPQCAATIGRRYSTHRFRFVSSPFYSIMAQALFFDQGIK